MRKIKLVVLLVLLFCSVGHAQTTANDLVGLCAFDGNCATYIADNVAGGARLDNNSWLTARNQAGSADINILRVDATDDTQLNADTGDIVKISIADTDQVEVSDGAITPTTDNDIDLGSASKEYKDAFFDGTVTLDALSMPLSVVAGANTACSTTCTGLCLFGVNNAATEADIVDCAGATADECLCVE